ncbi:hypothetical protein AGMMS50239_01750 [Bacteroidia bacterium]|nr:hypothetical protein AGMMS50239_01750 [Bacteroidia bacterium]
MEFASWISIEFKLYLLMEFQRLKEEENKQLGWSAKRELAKINQIAIQQMQVLQDVENRKMLK